MWSLFKILKFFKRNIRAEDYSLSPNEFTDAVIAVYLKSLQTRIQEGLVFNENINAYCAFEYDLVKDILNSPEDGIGVSTISIGLNNIYFSTDDEIHKKNKKATIQHFSFLSSKFQYFDNEYTRVVFDKFINYLPQNEKFDLVDYLINPIVLINIFKEYEFLEIFPEFNPHHHDFSYEMAIQKIKAFFEDTDKLEFMIKEHLESGGILPAKMLDLLNEMLGNNKVENYNLPKYLRSLIFVAAETTASYVSTFVYVIFTKFPQLLNDANNQSEFYWIGNEVLRIYTPVPFVYRTVWKDMTFAGVSLQKGDMVILYVGTANVDPNHFESPFEIKNNRQKRHLAFGSGGYACIGRFASYRMALNLLSYLIPYKESITFNDKNAKHYFHNSIQKLPVIVTYNV